MDDELVHCDTKLRKSVDKKCNYNMILAKDYERVIRSMKEGLARMRLPAKKAAKSVFSGARRHDI
jgi:hypothetical protein